MAAKVCDAILVATDSDDFYFILRVLAKGCINHKYQVYRWDIEEGTIEVMNRQANRIMKEILQENKIAYPQRSLGDASNSSTSQTGNILWEYLSRGVHYHVFNPNVVTRINENPRMFKIYEDGRRSNRGKKTE